jgi:hypothetical protein
MPDVVQITCTDANKLINRVVAIKALRGLLDLSLKDAKEYVDNVQDNPNEPLIIKTYVSIRGTSDASVTRHLNDLESQGIITSINSPINDMRMQLVDLIKDATDAECFGLASDIAGVCDKYLGLSTAFIRGDKQ